MSSKKPNFEAAARRNLLAIADAYAAATGLSIATVSRKFHGQQAFLSDYRDGKCSITASKIEAMLAAFRAQWPDNARWPRVQPIQMPGPAGRKISKNMGTAA